MIIPNGHDDKSAPSQHGDQYIRDIRLSSECGVNPQFNSGSALPESDDEEPGPPQYEAPIHGTRSLQPLVDDKSGIDNKRESILSQPSTSSSIPEPGPDAEFRTAAMQASAAFQSDGRFQISIDESPGSLPMDYASPIDEPGVDLSNFVNAPPMNVNIMIVGSRGDVQPFLALGRRLRQHGHTVRLTTHETFRQPVKEAGLRFFNIGGNPHELMSYMVRNPGLMPGIESLTNGDITRKQMMVAEMLERCWRSCYEPDDAQEGSLSFSADTIISNPPTFAHIHCAEALGIPLLMSFTMPWSPTTAFPHPLVNVRTSQAEPRMTNYLTYGLADAMAWQGLGHTINKFRRKRLGLPPISGAGIIERCNVPWTYCMSPALVPKPQDWANHIDVVGFYFLDLATKYTPPEDLVEFLGVGKPPIYIGFGSIVVQDPIAMTKTILSAITQANVRAVVSAGWGSLDSSALHDAQNPNIFILGNVPHDWLFEHVSVVVHHGGAGTAAIGLRCGKPTVVVPFFGDQPWWADQIYARGAGPAPIPHKQLTTLALVDAIKSALSEETKAAARRVGELIRSEDGVKNGMDSFHRHLPLLNMRCDLDPRKVATWYSRSHKLRLSAFAAQVLAEKGVLDVNKLELHRPREYITRVHHTNPISGTLSPAVGVVGDVVGGVGGLFTARPEKGVIKLVKAGPEAARGILEGLHHGMNNAPKIYGGSVREPGKVTGFKSGLREGRKSVVMGFYDGFTDILKEPVNGFKKHGVLGGVGGVVIGLTNAVVKPTAGIVGMLSQPVEGTFQSARSLLAKPATERHATRYAEGVAAFKESNEAEREAVIRMFEEKARSRMKGKQKSA
ncbi:glycosyltransferase family 1 protein [Rhizoctonia solani 123E]|uniref:Glycosyltransferase family 1 protein n=1 Tax=Rhizoctonia solani 123E TaxID=1423351 RepID=A0A074RP54_9AGAM|nr:glycosyltransferase family 1 protein [Rhizoctonia solani 123E]